MGNRGRAYATGALGVVAALCVIPSAATADPGVPAPPGSAGATSLSVGDLLAVSRTGANATHDGGDASAAVLVVGNQPVLGTGGTQHGAGHQDGALLDTGATPLGRVEVAPWDATVTDDGGTRTARGRAAALGLDVLDADTLSVTVLSSQSTATHSDGRSTGTASTDGARVRALDGAVDLTVLHAESSSESGGSTYLAGLNGTEVGTDEQLGAACDVDVVVAAVGCLSTGGGAGDHGTTTTRAKVLTATVPAAPAADTTILGTGAGAGNGGAVSGTGTTRGSGSAPGRANAGSGTASGLPFTGGPLAPLAAAGAVALAAGAWLRAAAGRWGVALTR